MKHGLILAICTLILLFPYLSNPFTWAMIATLSLTHILQDYAKVQFEKKHNKRNKTWPFFLDQTLHLVLILILGSQLGNFETMQLSPNIESLYFNNNVVLGITLLILVSFTFDIVIFQYRKRKHHHLKYHRHYKDISERFLTFLIFYLIFLGFLGVGNIM